MLRLSAVAVAAAVLTALSLAAPAHATSVTVTPSTPTPGVDVLVRGDGLGARTRGSVSLASGRVAFRTSRSGRFTTRLAVPATAATGRRVLTARAGRRRVKAPVRIVGTVRASSTLVATGGGRRLLLSPDRGPAGARLRLTGSGFPRRARLTATLGSARLGGTRTRRSGSFSLRARVPARAPGTRSLTVKARRARAGAPFRLQSAAEAAVPAIAAAGDIACDPADRGFNGGAGTAQRCRQRAPSDGILASDAAAVLPLGDEQYERGTLAQFAASYHPSWGRLNSRAFPVPGNREYETPGAAGYYGYFGARAGAPDKGYYSYDLGSWHVIALNSNCEFVACAAGSAQEQWLRADLAAHRTGCTLAYWHHPRWSSGNAARDEDVSAMYNDLYAARVELLLVGHKHIYERYAPLGPTGATEPSSGVRQIIVGTGGEEQSSLQPAPPGVEARSNTSFGFLRVALRPTGYDWQFVPVAGGTLTDHGSSPCH
jgi:hypothetical protein